LSIPDAIEKGTTPGQVSTFNKLTSSSASALDIGQPLSIRILGCTLKPPKGARGPHVTKPSIARKEGKKARTCRPAKGDQAERVFERPSFREAQGSPPKEGQVTGRPFFWFVFFGRAKKMNEKYFVLDRQIIHTSSKEINYRSIRRMDPTETDPPILSSKISWEPSRGQPLTLDYRYPSVLQDVP
jgi:hypothetical protein